ncbi:nucleoside-diphosphate kinase [Streptomyces sp. NPDC051569]|uniref:nucleoside-diphosphate kinase n=1 Tax=Streptomyces sp. NPDC051569 TaxID=3365661 RepID=UPI00379CEB11
MPDLDYRRTALMVITPDAVHRDLGAEIVRRVHLAGFRVAAHRLWPAAPGNLDAFHRRNEPVARDPELYRLVEALFDFGPLLALAVQEGEGRPPYDVHRRLAELKGRGDPAYAAPGSIRKDLGSINTILNIVHSSDDAEDTAREAAPFLEGGHGPLESGLPELHRCLRLLGRGRPPERRMFGDVLAGVRARVLTALWPRLTDRQRAAVDEWHTTSDMSRLAGPDGSRLLAALLPAGHGLDGVVTPPEYGGENPGGPAPVEVAALARLGVVLDPWEHLVLATSRYYPPLPAGRAAGPRADPARRLTAAGRAVSAAGTPLENQEQER